MTKSDHVKIKLEFDRIVRRLAPLQEKGILTADECMHEIGRLRVFIYNMGITEINKGD